METRICSKCKEEKEITEFYSQKKKRSNGEEYIYYNLLCKQCISQKYIDNKEEYNKKSVEWMKNNRDKYNAIVKRTEKKNAEKRKAGRKQWRQENPDKIKGYAKSYKQKQFRFTSKEWEACKQYFDNCCAYCGITELEAKEKYNKGLHKEHVLNEGNNDLSNCVTACTGCNSSKGKDDYTKWYTPENPIYDENRLNIMETWLKEDYKIHIKIN